MQSKRYFIVLEALLAGVTIKYKPNWQLFLDSGVLYQKYIDKGEKEWVHKSVVTLQEFLNNYREISNEDLKRIFGNMRLHNLQEKLIGAGAT